MMAITDAQLAWLNEHPTYLRVGLGGNYKNCGTLYPDGSFEPMAPTKTVVLRHGCLCVGELREDIAQLAEAKRLLIERSLNDGITIAEDQLLSRIKQTTEDQLAGLIMDADLPKRLQAENETLRKQLAAKDEQLAELGGMAEDMRDTCIECKEERDAMKARLQEAHTALTINTVNGISIERWREKAIELALHEIDAALAPSPAGRDCGCENSLKCWGGSPGIKCRRPFPSPAGREG
jgi:hypothetical protein